MSSRKGGTARRAVVCGAAVALLAVAGTGCKTAPAKDTKFTPDTVEMTAGSERFPFQRVWVKPGVDRSHYDWIFIPPVNTHYLLENTGWKAANPGNATLESAAQELAIYTRQTFISAFQERQKREDSMLVVRDRKGMRTLVLELAITELVPAKAALGAIGLAAPVAGQAAVGAGAKVTAGRPSVAIEGRVRDGRTGEVLMMFADRQERQWRVVDLKAVSWWGHARPILDDWARQCAELANTPATHPVKDRSKFTLQPW